MKRGILMAVIAAAIVANGQTRLQQAGMTGSVAHDWAPQGALTAIEEVEQPGDAAVVRAPLRASSGVEAGYYRPAGAFYADHKVVNGVYTSYYYAPMLVMTPYEDYTFSGYDGAASYTWRYQQWNTDKNVREWHEAQGQQLTATWGIESDTVPQLTVSVGGNSDTYQLQGHKMSGNSSNPTIAATMPSWIASLADMQATWGYKLLLSSHYFGGGGRQGDHYAPTSYLSGATPWGSNDKGWWFGKNGGDANGVASVFEKPQHPYLLNGVNVIVTQLQVAEPTTLTCKVYRLDGTQQYVDGASVSLPATPGTLVATGTCYVTASTAQQTGNMLVFTLDGSITVDYPIMVALEGYNDSECDGLTNFSVLISNEKVDEGFGEQAYIKREVRDDAGNVTDSYWQGLNNFFGRGELKSGFTILIDADHPYLAYNYPAEDGEYTFEDQGGEMVKEIVQDDITFTTHSIEFYSSCPSGDGAWTVQDVPSWLSIILEDDEDNNGDFNGVVTAIVNAEPLPAGVPYREALVRFAIPGNYKIYKLMQGDADAAITGDVNADGEVTVADVNAVIDIILNGSDNTTLLARADVNGDGEVTVADVNAIIDIILNAQ